MPVGKNLTITLLLSVSASVWAAPPEIIAHRGGTGDGPENTEYVINKSIKNNADAIWITIQLTKDNVIVLYRPSDLSVLTNLKGPVSAYTAQQLKNADAAYLYSPPIYPLRGQHIGIPALNDILKKWPKTFFYLDIKSPDASAPQFSRVLQDTLQKNNAVGRVRVYSTDAKYLAALPDNIPKFESRDMTRAALVNITMNHTCTVLPQKDRGQWYGFEFDRKVQVAEKFTLGIGVTDTHVKWDKEAFRCFKENKNNKVILFGINTLEDYQQARTLGADGVLVDSPEKFKNMARRSGE